MGCYGFRLKVATTPSKNVEKYGHHHVSSKDSTRVGCLQMFREFGIESQIPLGQIGRKLTLDSAWPVLERSRTRHR
jgi:hypothetical protein